MSEAEPHSTFQSQAELVSTEAGCFGLDDLQGPVAQETASPVLARDTVSPELGPMLMDIKLGGDSDPPAQCETTGACTYAQVVSGQDTSVFRPTPAETTALDVKHEGHRSVRSSLCDTDSSCLFQAKSFASQRAPVVAAT